jgi:glycosyltransferase involved in cell wall biosynthesis
MKYSIIIPTFNGLDYLPACIETIVSQTYDDYELIVSDDHSQDGTADYLCALYHPKIRVLFTPRRMSMAEHWEWALIHARGEWCIFVGQDDGLQLYFFELADILTRYAARCGIRAIMSARAYFFWPGCECVFGERKVDFDAMARVEHCGGKWKTFQVLSGVIPYFELPEMYTTSLFHRDILEEARVKQCGKVFVTHPQDANLAAIACSLDAQYIRSSIPLGWVGSSPKSAGIAVGEKSSNLRAVYLDLIRNSKLEYCPLIGPFSLDSLTLYFWGALVQSEKLQGEKFRAFIMSRFVRYFVLVAAKFELSHRADCADLLEELKAVYAMNSCSERLLNALYCAYPLYRRIFLFCIRARWKLLRVVKKKFSYRRDQTDSVSMIDASRSIKEGVSAYIHDLKKNIL